MKQRLQSAGRGVARPALALLVAGMAAGIVLAAGHRREDVGDRGPAAVPNASVTAPIESTVGSVRHVFRDVAPELLRPDSSFPRESVRLLWFEGRRAAPQPGGRVVVLDGTGGALGFDDHLRPRRVRLQLEGREPTSIAGASHGFWVVSDGGAVALLDCEGRVQHATPGPFDYATVASGENGSAWLVRSAHEFAFRLPSSEVPLLVGLDTMGSPARRIGSVPIPEHVLLTELAGAGHIAVTGEGIYYAPFVRDEVVAFSLKGDTSWVARRGLPQTTPEPRFEVSTDGPMIDYAPVNLGIALGPDGRLYVLSVPGFTTAQSRLDVFDPETGILERSALLDSPLPTVAVARDGRVYTLDPFELLTGVAPREREAFARFDMELLDGGRMTLEDLRGRVALVNFWASWCGPCREEMPALDGLVTEIADPDFAFVTLNEDIDSSDARAFVSQYGFEFPVLLGRGDLRRTYHYVGLPFTVLLDRQGRVVKRWIGYAGHDQVDDIRSLIRNELARVSTEPKAEAEHHHTNGGGLSH